MNSQGWPNQYTGPTTAAPHPGVEILPPTAGPSPAELAVADRSIDVADCRELLDMLGLREDLRGCCRTGRLRTELCSSCMAGTS